MSASDSWRLDAHRQRHLATQDCTGAGRRKVWANVYVATLLCFCSYSTIHGDTQRLMQCFQMSHNLDMRIYNYISLGEYHALNACSGRTGRLPAPFTADWARTR